MRLADFVDANTEAILSEWEKFARSLLPAAEGMDVSSLRDHAEEILRAVSADLRRPQSEEEQTLKSLGQVRRPPQDPDTAAETHGQLRATSGFTLKQLVAEYRALRASVLKLWAFKHVDGPDAARDVTRFNEAIDQAVAESVDFFVLETERWRNVFLGVLGHDLRGPLNAILLTAQVLSRLNDGAPPGVLTERLINGGERMRRLLDDLLDYSRTSLLMGIPVTPAATDLARACEDEVELQRAAWPTHSISLVAEGDTKGLWDASRIRQALGNLITNAAKYGNSGAPIQASIVGHENEVKLSVENSGPTIPQAKKNALFQPFHREAYSEGAAERASLGLGLFIVRQIAEAHAGTVEVRSDEESTVFSMILPRPLVR
jgi:signal transduction histidine kinase